MGPNYFPSAYPGAMPQMPVQYPMPTPLGPASRSEIVRVNGENGARALPLGPNSNALLLDESAPIVWLVQTDGAGYKTVQPYKIEPYKPEAPADTRSLENRIKRLEEIVNAKSDSWSDKPNHNAGSGAEP